MANLMQWNQDQQSYVGEINDQASGYLVRVEVDGDVVSEDIERFENDGFPRDHAENSVLNPESWLDVTDNDRVTVTRVRPLSEDEMREPHDFYQPGDAEWASGRN